MRKVFLVEDHPIFRLGLKEIISQEKDLTVCGEAEDVASAVKGIRETAPDVVVVDISLKGGDGLDLIAELSSWPKKIPSLVISMYEEELYAVTALKTGASGYIMKQQAPEKVVMALRKVLGGEVFLSEAMVGSILGGLAGRDSAARNDPLAKLSDRELEVFRLIGNGIPTREIADRLHLSVKTVGTHKERIKEKLNIMSGSELTTFAVRWMTGKRTSG